MTKLIIVVKMPGCKLLYIIQKALPDIKDFFAASDWPRRFLQLGCFCLAFWYTEIILFKR